MFSSSVFSAARNHCSVSSIVNVWGISTQIENVKRSSSWDSTILTSLIGTATVKKKTTNTASIRSSRRRRKKASITP